MIRTYIESQCKTIAIVLFGKSNISLSHKTFEGNLTTKPVSVTFSIPFIFRYIDPYLFFRLVSSTVVDVHELD